ncbi:multiheme c-type cytochrome [Anaerolineales bacterium HSG24]|nr:multiheme c-type cytochrome [Anaerolineales bacterium HSG24]
MKRLVILASFVLLVAMVAAQCGTLALPESAAPTNPQEVAVEQTNSDDLGIPNSGFEAPQFVGTKSCGEEGCHVDTYDSFMKTGHPYKLNKVVDSQPPEYPYSEITDPPEGYTWDDITYVIGGYGWKARFLDKDGYIITGDEDATTQYNLYNEDLDLGDNWVGYHAGEENVPYDCGPCHTTNYQPDGHQDDLPGITGTWSETGVQCEECHGPGSQHNEDPYLVKMKIDRDSEQCGQCHIRGDVESINASGGFIKHHEQYEELFESKKRLMRCVDCHNPHETVKNANGLGIRTSCKNCHFEEERFQKITDREHANCIDCHMPRISKNAVGDVDRYTGDLRTHLMGINPFETVQFDEEGATSQPYLALDFACKSCHYEGGPASVETDEVLMEFSLGHHERDQIGTYNEE